MMHKMHSAHYYWRGLNSDGFTNSEVLQLQAWTHICADSARNVLDWIFVDASQPKRWPYKFAVTATFASEFAVEARNLHLIKINECFYLLSIPTDPTQNGGMKPQPAHAEWEVG